MLANKAKQGNIAEKAAKLWNADPDFIKLVHSGNNLVYRIKCSGKTCYLHLTHSLSRSRAELTAAIDYQRYLFETGAHVCQPILSLNEEFIETIFFPGDIFFAYVNEEVQGDTIHFEHNDKVVYEAWGKSLAHLHRTAKSYHPSEAYQFLHWHDLWGEVKRFSTNENDILQQEVEDIDTWFGNLNINQHLFGVTHGDHSAANVFYDGQKVHIIDFEQPVYHWYFADMARPFLDLANKEFSDWRNKAMWFFDGYYTIMPFDEKVMEYLPWFMRMKNLDLYLWMKNLPLNSFTKVKLAELWENIQKPLLSWE